MHCVVLDKDGSVVGRHPTREKAKRHLRALYANVEDAKKPQNKLLHVRSPEGERRFHLPQGSVIGGPKLHELVKPRGSYSSLLTDEERTESRKQNAKDINEWHRQIANITGLPHPDDIPEDAQDERGRSLRWKARHDLQDAWDNGMRRALTHGQIDIKTAKARGYYGDEREMGYNSYNPATGEDEQVGGWRPMPSHVVHVSTNADAVAREGLKTRAELGYVARGLGGGPENTVSVTSDTALGEDIYHALHEHHAFLTGKLSVDDLLKYADNPPDGSTSFGYALRDMTSPEEIDSLRRGVRKYKGMQAPDPNPDWHIVKRHATRLTGSEATTAYPEGIPAVWERPATEEEKHFDRSQFYKKFSAARNNMGGHRDPLFLANDAHAFAQVDPAGIGILHLRTHPGAQGWTIRSGGEHHAGADSGEWRTGEGMPFDVESVDKPKPRWIDEFKRVRESKAVVRRYVTHQVPEHVLAKPFSTAFTAPGYDHSWAEQEHEKAKSKQQQQSKAGKPKHIRTPEGERRFGGSIGSPIRAGRCFQLALQHLKDHPEHHGMLVHGTAKLEGGKRVQHAWVQEDPAIGSYEPENDRHFSQREFERTFSPVSERAYTPEQAMVNMVQQGHYGPWHEASQEDESSPDLRNIEYLDYGHSMARLYPTDSRGLNEVFISNLITNVQHRRQGSAQAFMEHLTNLADQQGVHLGVVPGNDRLRQWYERHGFTVIPEERGFAGQPYMRRVPKPETKVDRPKRVRTPQGERRFHRPPGTTIIGVTGTTSYSARHEPAIDKALKSFRPSKHVFVVGGATGVDVNFARKARAKGFTVHAVLPREVPIHVHARRHSDTREWTDAVLHPDGGVNVSATYMKRNDRIVHHADRLIAFPRTRKEEQRSGTWATIRRARKAGKQVTLHPLDEAVQQKDVHSGMAAHDIAIGLAGRVQDIGTIPRSRKPKPKRKKRKKLKLKQTSRIVQVDGKSLLRAAESFSVAMERLAQYRTQTKAFQAVSRPLRLLPECAPDGSDIESLDLMASLAGCGQLGRKVLPWLVLQSNNGYSQVLIDAAREEVKQAQAQHNGVAVLLMLAAGDAQRLAVPDGEDPRDMHVTLSYFAQPAADIGDDVRQEVASSLEDALGDVTFPIQATAFATATFNANNAPDDADRPPCQVLLVQSDALAELHDIVQGAVDVFGEQSHPIWVPHITIGYGIDADAVPTDIIGQDLSFDRVALAWGDDQSIVGGMEIKDLRHVRREALSYWRDHGYPDAVIGSIIDPRTKKVVGHESTHEISRDKQTLKPKRQQHARARNVTREGDLRVSQGQTPTHFWNHITGHQMKKTEPGVTFEQLFATKGIKLIEGVGELRRTPKVHGEGAYTTPLDYMSDTHGVEVKSVSSLSANQKVGMRGRSKDSKIEWLKDNDKIGLLVAQEVDQENHTVHVYTSLDIGSPTIDKMDYVGSYKYTDKEFDEAQKAANQIELRNRTAKDQRIPYKPEDVKFDRKGNLTGKAKEVHDAARERINKRIEAEQKRKAVANAAKKAIAKKTTKKAAKKVTSRRPRTKFDNLQELLEYKRQLEMETKRIIRVRDPDYWHLPVGTIIRAGRGRGHEVVGHEDTHVVTSNESIRRRRSVPQEDADRVFNRVHRALARRRSAEARGEVRSPSVTMGATMAVPAKKVAAKKSAVRYKRSRTGEYVRINTDGSTRIVSAAEAKRALAGKKTATKKATARRTPGRETLAAAKAPARKTVAKAPAKKVVRAEKSLARKAVARRPARRRRRPLPSVYEDEELPATSGPILKRARNGKAQFNWDNITTDAQGMIDPDSANGKLIKNMFEGTFGGNDLQTSVDDISVNTSPWEDRKSIEVSGSVSKGNRIVGHWGGQFYSDGEMHDDDLVLDGSVQDGGFATHFINHIEGQVDGITSITVHANIDVGGYAWASRGFGWNPEYYAQHGGYNARSLREGLQSRVRYAMGRHPELSQDGLKLLELLNGIDPTKPVSQWPSPKDIASFGEDEGTKIEVVIPELRSPYGRREVLRPQKKYPSWIGKETMLGSSWAGKILLRAPTPQTKQLWLPEPDWRDYVHLWEPYDSLNGRPDSDFNQLYHFVYAGPRAETKSLPAMLEDKKLLLRPRHVRTSAGVRRFGQAVGAEIDINQPLPSTATGHRRRTLAEHLEALGPGTRVPFEAQLATRLAAPIDPNILKDLQAHHCSATSHLIYHSDGTVTFDPERQELHRKMIEESLNWNEKRTARIRPVKNPWFNILGGGPATGKSTFTKAHPEIFATTATVNADDYKAKLPEYTKPDGTFDAAFVHEESSYIVKMAVREGLSRSLPLTLDGTGDSSADSIRGKIKQGRDAGYKVQAYYATNEVETALKWAEERRKHTGRGVPESILRKTHKAISEVFPEVRDDFDTVTLFDTNEGGMRIIGEKKEGGRFEVADQSLWDRFLAKGKVVLPGETS